MTFKAYGILNTTHCRICCNKRFLILLRRICSDEGFFTCIQVEGLCCVGTDRNNRWIYTFWVRSHKHRDPRVDYILSGCRQPMQCLLCAVTPPSLGVCTLNIENADSFIISVGFVLCAYAVEDHYTDSADCCTYLGCIDLFDPGKIQQCEFWKKVCNMMITNLGGLSRYDFEMTYWVVRG